MSTALVTRVYCWHLVLALVGFTLNQICLYVASETSPTTPTATATPTPTPILRLRCPWHVGVIVRGFLFCGAMCVSRGATAHGGFARRRGWYAKASRAAAETPSGRGSGVRRGNFSLSFSWQLPDERTYLYVHTCGEKKITVTAHSSQARYLVQSRRGVLRGPARAHAGSLLGCLLLRVRGIDRNIRPITLPMN